MLPDTLYDLAFLFKKTKLWRKLYDTQLFAVRHGDGTIGYCCVMGMMGEHLALAEYPGAAGLDSYRRLNDSRRGLDIFDDHELALTQDCLMVSFQNKSELRPREIAEVNAYTAAHGLTLRGRKAYPQFQRFRPHYLPWRLDDETDCLHLQEALEAALEVAERLTQADPKALDFTEGEPYQRSIPLLERINGAFVWAKLDLGAARREQFSSPEITDHISLAKLARCKKSGKEWACDIFMHMYPMLDEDGEDPEDPVSAPRFPFVLLVTETETGLVLGVEVVKELDDTLPLIRCLLQVAQKTGTPARILVLNDRTYAFFAKLAPAMGAKLVKRKRIPALDEAKQGFAEQFDEEDQAGTEDIGGMLAMLADPAAYDDMPDDMLLLLIQILESGALPDDVVRLVKRERTKRGL